VQQSRSLIADLFGALRDAARRGIAHLLVSGVCPSR
jgi:hypothetical protein